MTNTASGGRATAALKAESIAVSIMIAVLGTATAALHACPPEYEYEMACAPPCGPFQSGATGLDINEAGDIVGFATGLCYGERAFIWKAGTPNIQFLPMPAGTTSSRAYGINNKGQIVGVFVNPANPEGSGGFIIDNGVFFDMGTLPGGNWSEAYDVNDDGVAVGWWGNNVVGPSPLAMMWSGLSMTDLTPALGQPSSEASAINNTGAITGFVSAENYLYDGRAFVWDGERLIVLPPAPGAYTSYGTAINDLGQIVGYGTAECNPPARFCSESRGFLWDGSEMISLGSLPGYVRTFPADVNHAQQIVGRLVGQFTEAAFLWKDGQIYKLDDLVPGFDGINIGSGSARAINNAGEIAASVTSAAGSCTVRLTPKPTRLADLDCDGGVGSTDLAILIQDWGAKESLADLDASGSVDARDLGILLGDWDG